MIASSLAPESLASWSHSLRVCGRLIWNDCKQGLRKHLSGDTARDKILRVSGALFGLLFMAGLHFGAFSLVTYTALSPSQDQGALMLA